MSRTIQLLSLLLLAVLTFAVYSPGLHGTFAFDDGPNIVQNNALKIHSWSPDALWQAALSGDAGPLKRPVAMLSFALNYLTTGLDPYYFKLTNLGIHLINGLLIFWLCALLMQALRECCGVALDEYSGQWIAVLAAGAWMVDPINLTGVLYIVQRMTSLSALFTLLGVISYMHGRLRMCRSQAGGAAWMVLGTMGFGALAVLSKENGALLPLYCAACELSILRLKTVRADDRRWVVGYLLAFVVLPGIAALAYLAYMPAWLQHSYTARPFTMGERLLTEARALFYYLRLILAPSNVSLGLFHDDFGLSRSLLHPVTTLLSILGLVLLAGLAWISRRRYPVFTFAVLWFFAGQVMESTVLSLELIHEHRNYLPSVGPLLALFYFLYAGVVSADLRRAVRFGAVGLIGVFSLVTFVRADQWKDPLSLAYMQVYHHPRSARAQYELGRIYYIFYVKGGKHRDYLIQAREHFLRAAALDKSRQKPLFALIQVAYREGHAPEPALLERLDRRISTEPFQAGDTTDLINLVKCQQTRDCRLTENQMLGIFDAALRNPTVDRDLRSVILTWQGTYFANVLHERHKAQEIFLKVVQMEPQQVVYRTNLIQLMLVNGQPQAALRQLHAAQRADVLGAYREQIDHYRRLIDEAMRQKSLPVSVRAAEVP